MFKKTKDQPLLLVMFLGYPGSGKSYFAKQLAERIGAVRVNGDSLRVALYGSVENIPQNAHGPKSGIFKTIDFFAEHILRSGKSVVYDSHHNRRAVRKKLEQMAAATGARPVVVWMQTPPEIAKARATEREATADQLQMSHQKYHETLARQTANFDSPLPHENVIKIDGTAPFEEQFAVFRSYFEQ